MKRVVGILLFVAAALLFGLQVVAHSAAAFSGTRKQSSREGTAGKRSKLFSGSHPSFPLLNPGVDLVDFARYDAPAPPFTGIYQSNGFLALREHGFGAQDILIPVAPHAPPVNRNGRVIAIEVPPPTLVNGAGHRYEFSATPAAGRSVSYFPDRTIYRAQFSPGPRLRLTVYSVFGVSAAVLRLQVKAAAGPLRLEWNGKTLPTPYASVCISAGKGLPAGCTAKEANGVEVRMLVRLPQQTTLSAGDEADMVIGTAANWQAAEQTVSEIQHSPDRFSSETHKRWNRYLASTPLVEPAEAIHFELPWAAKPDAPLTPANQRAQGTGLPPRADLLPPAAHSISPRDLLRSEIWTWHGLLADTCQVRYLVGCPLPIADWNNFMGMWGNDGNVEAMALAATNQWRIARASILHWFHSALNARGDGTCAWTSFPSGASTFSATGSVRKTQSVPLTPLMVGEYIRLTGDTGILQAKPGGVAGDRTVWQALVAYENGLPKVREPHHTHLIEWLHIYETGWDDKDSPFVDLKGHATSSMDEQVYQLWSLQAMTEMARIEGSDPAPWQQRYSETRDAVESRLWDSAQGRYCDLDQTTGKLWTRGNNLDAFYYLFFERNPERRAAILRHLNNPQEFDGPLLPSLAFNVKPWGGYWRGPAWPREFGTVAIALAHAGKAKEGLMWAARGLVTNTGPVLPEVLDPRYYPPNAHILSPVRIMGYSGVNALWLPEVIGLRTFAGDRTPPKATRDFGPPPVVREPGLGSFYVRSMPYYGRRYNITFMAGKAPLIARLRSVQASTLGNQIRP